MDNHTRTPADLARETIRQLALRRLVPTPAHYAAVYQELEGVRSAEPAVPERSLPAWGELLRQLMRRWEARTPNWTQAQKRESLERLLATNAATPGKLAERLAGLVGAWGDGKAESAAVPETVHEAAVAPARSPELDGLRQLLLELLRLVIGDDQGGEGLAGEARSIALRLAAAATPTELAREAQAMKKLIVDVELSGRGRQEMLSGLHGLLHLVVSNMEELVPDERWIRGQIERLRDTLSRPLTTTAIADAQAAMRSVLIKQSTLKKSVREAEQSMKDLLADFLLRLGAMTDSAGTHSQRMESHVEKIRATGDLPELSEVVKSVVADMRQVQSEAAQMRSELATAHQRALELEARTRRLEAELAEASDMVRSDALTGTLNRRGLADSSLVEFARARREETTLCLAVLDVDNFKRLNDTLGHSAGDQALCHLAAALRRMLPPSDVVARYGGEEFVILLPDSGEAEAVDVMQRVQRGLTRDFFMHGNEKVLGRAPHLPQHFRWLHQPPSESGRMGDYYQVELYD